MSSVTQPAPARELVLSSEEKDYLRDALKRCSPATVEAACEFRMTGDAAHLPVIVHGVIERYVERERRPQLQGGRDDLRLIEDLAIDSLTMMEIVVLAEDVLRVSLDSDELRHLRTVGDVKRFFAAKVKGERMPGG